MTPTSTPTMASASSSHCASSSSSTGPLTQGQADRAAIPPSNGSSPLSTCPLHLVSLICRSLTSGELLAMCQCSHHLYLAATHPLVYQHGMSMKVDPWIGVQLMGPSGTFKTESKLKGAMKSRIGSQLRIMNIMMRDSPSFLSAMVESLSHAQSLRGLTLDLSNTSINLCRGETREQTELWLRKVNDWMRQLMKKYDGSIPLERVLLLRCGVDDSSGFIGMRRSSNSSSSDSSGGSSLTMSESDLLGRVRDAHPLIHHTGAREMEAQAGYDIQLKWIQDDDDNDEDDDGVAGGERKDDVVKSDEAGEHTITRPLHAPKRHGHGQRVSILMNGDHDRASFKRHASGFICFHGEKAARVLSNPMYRPTTRQYIGEVVIHTMLPSPFLPLLKLSSLQSLRYLCLTMDPMLLMTAAPYLPSTLVSLQVTSVAHSCHINHDNAVESLQVLLPSDLAQRLHHCEQLRHFSIIQRLIGSFDSSCRAYGSTPLASLYVLEELSEALPGLETIQWNVAINPTRLWLEYEGMCNNDEANAKAKVGDADAAVTASASASSSSSMATSSIHSHTHIHTTLRPLPPRVRHISSLLLSGSGRLMLPRMAIGMGMGMGMARSHDAQREFDFFKMVNRPQWREQNKDRWILNGDKQQGQDVEAVTSVLAWFDENVRHVRLHVDYDLSLINALATRWPDGIHSSITDLAVICLHPSPKLDRLPLLTNMHLTNIQRLALQFNSDTRLSDDSIRQILDSMPNLTDLTIQCAPTLLYHALPKLPALTCLTAPLILKAANQPTIKDRLVPLVPNLTSLHLTATGPSLKWADRQAETDETLLDWVSFFHSTFPSLCSLQYRHLPRMHPNEFDAFLSRRRELERQRKEQTEAAARQAMQWAEREMRERIEAARHVPVPVMRSVGSESLESMTSKLHVPYKEQQQRQDEKRARVSQTRARKDESEDGRGDTNAASHTPFTVSTTDFYSHSSSSSSPSLPSATTAASSSSSSSPSFFSASSSSSSSFSFSLTSAVSPKSSSLSPVAPSNDVNGGSNSYCSPTRTPTHTHTHRHGHHQRREHAHDKTKLKVGVSSGMSGAFGGVSIGVHDPTAAAAAMPPLAFPSNGTGTAFGSSNTSNPFSIASPSSSPSPSPAALSSAVFNITHSSSASTSSTFSFSSSSVMHSLSSSVASSSSSPSASTSTSSSSSSSSSSFSSSSSPFAFS